VNSSAHPPKTCTDQAPPCCHNNDNNARRETKADRFVKSGRSLRRKMWWGNCKMKAAVAGVILAVLFILVLLVCFGGGELWRRPVVGSPLLWAAAWVVV